MKRYEEGFDVRLPRRLPVIIRIDGIAFHTYTRKMAKPWDSALETAFHTAIPKMFKHMAGLVLAYWQSDEVSFVLQNNRRLNTEPWLDNRISKLVTHTASIFSVHFHKAMHGADAGSIPAFDARTFVLPDTQEVINYLIWRQQDAIRNSIQGLGQKYFSHRQLHGLSCNEIQELLFQAKDVNWNETPGQQKRGTTFFRPQYNETSKNRVITIAPWEFKQPSIQEIIKEKLKPEED